MHRLLVLILLAGVLLPVPAQQPTPPPFHPPVVVSTVEPTYPVNSVAFGTVILEVHLSESGEIEQVRVLNDIPPLTRQAEQAIAQWKFRPARLGDRPVPSVVPVAFTFVSPDLWPRFGGAQPKP